MHPKTYFIHLHKPFGFLTTHAFMLYGHFESAPEALAWVDRVFPGLDVEATRKRWAEPPAASSVPRVGLSLQVNIRDCDKHRETKRVAGKRVIVPTPVGHFRRDEADVTADLLKIFNLLQELRMQWTSSFQMLKRDYEERGTPARRQRLLEIKHAVETAMTWQTNLWGEYLKAQQRIVLEMPEPVALAA